MTLFEKFTIVVAVLVLALLASQQIEHFLRFGKFHQIFLIVPLIVLDVCFLSRALFNAPIRTKALRMLGYSVNMLSIALLIPGTAFMAIMAGGASSNASYSTAATWSYVAGFALIGLTIIFGLFYACRYHYRANTLEKVL